MIAEGKLHISVSGIVLAAFALLLCSGARADMLADEYSYTFPVGDFFGRKTGDAKARVSLTVEMAEGEAEGEHRCVITLSSSSHRMFYSALFLGFPADSSETLHPESTYLKKGGTWERQSGITEQEEAMRWELLGIVTGLPGSGASQVATGLEKALGWLRTEYKKDMETKLAAWSLPEGTHVYGKYNMPGPAQSGWREIRWVVPFRVRKTGTVYVAAACFTYPCDEERLLTCKCVTGPLPPQGTHPYFPLTVGSEWTYQTTTQMVIPGFAENPPEQETISLALSGLKNIDNRDCFVLKGTLNESYYYIEDGCVMLAGSHGWASIEEFLSKQGLNPVFPTVYLEAAPSAGSSWLRASVIGPNLEGHVSSRVLGFENVNVPAGAFDNCLKVESRTSVGSEGHVVIVEWFGMGVGRVKVSMRASMGRAGAKGMPVQFRLDSVLASCDISPASEHIEPSLEHRERSASPILAKADGPYSDMRLVSELRGQASTVCSAAFSPGAGRLVTGGDGIALWDTIAGECLWATKVPAMPARFSGQKALVLVVALSPDERVIATAGGNPIQLWDADTGECIRFLESVSSVWTLAFSPDGRRLGSGHYDGTIRLFDLDLLATESLGVRRGHSDGVTHVIFSRGNRLITAGKDGHVKIWDANTWGCLQTLAGHSRAVDWVALSSDRRFVASASSEGTTLTVWELETGRCVRTMESDSYIATFSYDGKYVVSNSEAEDCLHVWDLTNGQRVQTLDGYSGSVLDLVASPDGLYVASGDEIVSVWKAGL